MRLSMSSIVLVLSLVLVPSLALAQTSQVQWDQTNVSTPTQAQGLVYKLYVTPSGSTTPTTTVTLTSVLCGGAAPTVQCATVLPTAAQNAKITGTKSELTSSLPDGTQESAKSAPFFTPSAVPTNLRITP